MPSRYTTHPISPRRRTAVRRALIFLLAIAGLLGALPALASANQYDTLLASSTGSGVIDPSTSGEAAGYVFWSQSWTAPNGMQYAGFAYTSATFSSQTMSGYTGGVSNGFLGTGGNAPATLMFPWTDDCSITNNGHDWAHGGAAGNGNSCATSGSTSGWNYDNSEVESSNVTVNPQTSYSTLTLESFCQASDCKSPDVNESQVSNLSAVFNDPNGQPSNSQLYWASGGSSGWYQTNSSSPDIAFNATDPTGVCYLNVQATGPQTVNSGDLVAAPGTVDPGGAIGTEFSAGTSAPCDQSDNYSWILPANIASGTYSVAVQAANAGNYEGQGFTGSGSPTIAYASNTINVDDVTPSLGVTPSSDGQSGTLDVTVGPSGVGSVSCTQNGNAVTLTQDPGNPGSGAGTYAYNIPTVTTGLACTASNNDQNGTLNGSLQTPAVTLSDPGYSEGAWASGAQTIDVQSGSGDTVQYCLLDGSALTSAGSDHIFGAGGQNAIVTVGSNGAHTLVCSIESGSGVYGEDTMSVDVDAQQPSLTFSGAVPGTWYSNQTTATTATVDALAAEATTYSGIATITCTVNGGAPFNLSGIGTGVDSSSFVVTPNGQDTVACYAITGAGVQGPTQTETIDVDNPNLSGNTGLTPYGSSNLIDDGADPFSNGPSQTTWYRSSQSVTVTANDTGGSAPITSISCVGAPTNGTGTWPNTGPNTDGVGGESITITVQPPGGDLACTATDSAGTTYPLGAYEFQIDDTAPAGGFLPESAWPQPDDLELNVADSGSGVAYVHVYATLNGSRAASVDLGLATDEGGDVWMVQVPDGNLTPGEYTFYANVADNAGNSTQLTAGVDGGSSQMMLPFREDTTVSEQASDVTGTPDLAAPSSLQSLGSSPVGELAHAVHGGGLTAATIRSLAKATTAASCRTTGTNKNAKATKKKTSCTTARSLVLGYGKAVTLKGVLRNKTLGNKPIPSAVIDVYQEVASTSKVSLLGTTKTNKAGDYTYRVKGGASRLVFVAYPGTSELRSAFAQLKEQFAGSVTLKASRIRAGKKLILSGQVKGGYIPAGGVNVTISYQQVGAPGSGTLGTARTNGKGQYSFKQYFAARDKGLKYRLWVTVSAGQHGWPFTKAASRKFTRQVL
jgi:hypothetical protein